MPTTFSSPNVFIEEVASTVQTTQGVSPSTAAFVGFTTQGAVNTPTLVTSFDEYLKAFGTFSKNSFMTHNLAAFYSNGGQRAYINRVIPSDAVSASASVQSKTTNQSLAVGDSSTATYTQAFSGATSFKANSGASHIVPDSVTIKYRAGRTAVSSHLVRKRDGSTLMTSTSGTVVYEGRVDHKAGYTSSAGTGKVFYRSKTDDNTAITVTQVVAGTNTALSISVVGNDITVNSATDGGGLATSTAAQVVTAIGLSAPASALITAEVHTTGTIAAASIASLNGMVAYDSDLNAIKAGTFAISWLSSSALKTVTVSAAGTHVASTTNGAGSTATVDLRSGIFSVQIDVSETPDNAKNFFVSYTPASTTITLTSGSSVNSSGQVDLNGSSTHITGGGGVANSCFVNVSTGAWSISFVAGSTHIPLLETELLATYKISAWTLTPVAGGEWGNNLKIQIQGSVEYFTASTASYSKHNVFLLLKDENDVFQLKETYEDLDLTDSTSDVYFPDVVSELSELIDVVTPGADEAPGELYGVAHTEIMAGGDESSSTRVVTFTLANPTVAPRTVTITYTDTASATKTITDDGNGNLIGAVDSSYATTVSGLGANQINYTTGAINVKLTSAVNAPSLVSITYYTSPAETAHVELFGDTTKDYTYTIGSDDFAFYVTGDDGTFTSSTYGRDQFSNPTLADSFEGIYALDKVEEMLQVCVPDFAGDVTVTTDLLDYADTRATGPQGGDRFIILTVPVASTAQEAVDWFRFELVRDSNFAALYWPWIKVKDPLSNNRPLAIPPLGHIAGVYARTDANKNVGKGPGGTVDGKLTYLIGLETTPTLADRDLVFPNRINSLISSNASGTAVWGVRTIASDPRWRLINARRLFMFVERSVYSITQWAVFENNGPALWSKLKGQLVSYLTGLFNDGYFEGSKPSDAFFVVVDSTNNDQASIDAGKLNISIGLKPFKSVEFVVISFQLIQNQ